MESACSTILYEYPFNERIRTYLRLEQLLSRLKLLTERESTIDHHFALVTLFEIMDVSARMDLKSDVLKDLEKQKQNLESFRHNPTVASTALESVLEELESCFSHLNQQSGKAGQSLKKNDWLMALRSRIDIPGGTCEFDLPTYFAWQHKNNHIRKKDIKHWCLEFEPLDQSINLLLKLFRSTGTFQKINAANGLFQQNLAQNRTFQLLQLRLASQLNVTPEISCNRLMVFIRFVPETLSPDKKQLIALPNLDFELSLCA